MRRILPAAMACLVLATAALCEIDAFAQDRPRDHGRGREQVQAESEISLDEAVARAERRYKARAVRAEEKRHGDRIEYRIRLLGKNGRVFEVRVDAASGREI